MAARVSGTNTKVASRRNATGMPPKMLVQDWCACMRLHASVVVVLRPSGFGWNLRGSLRWPRDAPPGSHDHLELRGRRAKKRTAATAAVNTPSRCA